MEWNLKFMLMNGMLILLIAHYEGKLLCRNFIFLLLCGFMLLGITVFHVFLQSDWRVFEYTVNLPSGMPYANAYLWGIMQSFLVIFVVGDFVYRDNIEKTNDVFWHGISVIWNIWQESLLGWWSYFWYWMLFPCLFVCSFIYLRVALDLMSDFTFSICWQFLCQPCYSCPVWFSW